jgi:GNAT superfamily N-acetyltransferase
MGEIVQDLSAPTVVAAIEAQLCEMVSTFGRLPRAEVHDDPEMLWFITGVPFPLFNGVVRTNLASLDLDAKIAATLAQFRSRHLPMIWWTSPSTQPGDLGRHLVGHGLTHAGDSSGMAVDLRALHEGTPVPAGLTIERVDDAATLQHYAQAFITGYEAPQVVGDTFVDLFTGLGTDHHGLWRHYVGWWRGQAVATSSLFLVGGVAGIWNVATVPDARRQGIGVALTRVPLCEARALGYRVGILLSSPMAFTVYRRLGFHEYCTVGQYVGLT